jgi:hypothetical protein
MKPDIKGSQPPSIDIAKPDEKNPDKQQHESLSKSKDPQQKPSENKNKDPYKDNGLHIVGHIKNRTKITWYIAISQNGQRLKIITANDLASAGYHFEPINDCAAWATYQETKRFLLCDVPTQTTIGT